MPIFETPNTILTGRGCLKELANHARGLGTCALVVTGQSSMRKCGALEAITILLAQAGMKVLTFEGVEHDPTVETVDEIRKVFKNEKCDVIVGLGGGSALDAAKAAAGVMCGDEPTAVYLHEKKAPESKTPVIAIPSTFGTGSEVTAAAVLSDHSKLVKKSYRYPNMLPVLSVIDPELGSGAPKPLIASCGMDALTQAIESFLSKNATLLTQTLSLQSASLILNSLCEYHDDPENIDHCENCSMASMMAGISLHNARLGLVHGLAHPLGAMYGLIHGRICATLLPHVLRFNKKSSADCYQMLSAVAGIDIAEKCEQLLHRFSMPTDLSDLNIDDTARQKIISMTLPSGSTLANPEIVTEENLTAFLKSIGA